MSLEKLLGKLGRVRIIPHRISENAAMNLAIDRVLLKNAEKTIESGGNFLPILRTHQYSNPAVVLGYNQKKEGYFNDALAKQRGVELTIRDSGGGHMYFSSNDVQFTYVAPVNVYGSGTIIENYQRVNSIFVEALRRAGYAEACLGNTSIRMDSGNGENKIVAGTARRFGDGVFMQQGGILVDDYASEIFEMMNASEEEVELWERKVTSLSRWTDGNPNLLPKKLKEIFPDAYVEDLTAEELEQARVLREKVYENHEKILSGKKDAYICLIAGFVKEPFSTKGEEQEVEL